MLHVELFYCKAPPPALSLVRLNYDKFKVVFKKVSSICELFTTTKLDLHAQDTCRIAIY